MSHVYPDHYLTARKWEAGFNEFAPVRHCDGCGIELEDKREKKVCVYCRLEQDDRGRGVQSLGPFGR